ncbi:hypothetical protein V494_02773 [Pseudogymnoascus sp. VKM F-4513 (FW-928)]|nr:hypothetical protein V494_02773 [Pseudogymnoascus sp. VKM F-4513 (FW-928)]
MPTIHEVPGPNNEGFSMPNIPGEYPTNSPRFTSEDWILSTPRTKTLIEIDKIPTRHNVLAIFFSWLLLGGYMVLPGTFASLHNLEVGKDNTDRVGKVLRAVNNRPLLIVGGASCFIGVIGISSLSWIQKKNSDWLLSHTITPNLLHSAAGLLNTLVNIYTIQHGVWSVIAVITATITGSSIAILALIGDRSVWPLGSKYVMGLAEDTDAAYGASDVDSACGSELDVTYCCLEPTSIAYAAKRSTAGTVQRHTN